MSEIEAATFKCDLHAMAATIGAKLEVCKHNGQLSAGCHLVMAREEIFKALHSFNPKLDERNLELGFSRNNNRSNPPK